MFRQFPDILTHFHGAGFYIYHILNITARTYTHTRHASVWRSWVEVQGAFKSRDGSELT